MVEHHAAGVLAALEGVQRQRSPHLRGLAVDLRAALRELERRRHDADDRVGATVESDRAPHRARIAAEAPLPQPVTEDRHVLPGLIVRLDERPADRRRHAQDREHRGRDTNAGDPLRIARAGQLVLRRAIRADARERALERGEIDEVGRRHPDLSGAPEPLVDQHQPLRLGVSQRTQQHRVHQAEDCAVGPDSEGQGDHGDGREHRRLQQYAAGVAQVGRQ